MKWSEVFLPILKYRLYVLLPSLAEPQDCQRPNKTHHITEKIDKQDPQSFSLRLISLQSSHPRLDTGWTLRLMNMRYKWGQKCYIDFKIPWFCYSAMHSNDQLFGLRPAFLRSLSPAVARAWKLTLAVRNHQREFGALILSCSNAALSVRLRCSDSPNWGESQVLFGG